jgi:hypothetical protein
MGDDLFVAGGRADRRDETNSHISQFFPTRLPKINKYLHREAGTA